jgi:hypothetical protein
MTATIPGTAIAGIEPRHTLRNWGVFFIKEKKMEWYWWVIGICVVIMIFDWLIVMGSDPKKWKGGDKE